MIITREAKIYPNKNQVEILEHILEESRLLYNACLELKKTAYIENKKTITRFELQKQVKEFGEMPATLRQMVVYRLNNAYEQFFRRGGYPRFKKYGRYRSIPLRQFGTDYKIDGNYINVWKSFGLGYIKMRGMQKLNNPKGARIVKRASGWYLQVMDEVSDTPKENKKEIGIDLGLRYFVADSDGNKVEAPKFFRKAQKKLRVQQRRLKNKTKFSQRWKKQSWQIAKTHEHIANQRKDWLHKLSRKYANENGKVYAENLNILGMVRNHFLAKSIFDASWNMFLNMLDYKLKMLDRQLVLVPAQYTSQKCSSCGELVQKSLSVRTHLCPYCGFTADRDYNASLNILRDGQSRQALTYGSSQSVA